MPNEKFPYCFTTEKDYFTQGSLVPTGTYLRATNSDLSSWEKGWAKYNVESLPEVKVSMDLILEGTVIVIALSKAEGLLLKSKKGGK